MKSNHEAGLNGEVLAGQSHHKNSLITGIFNHANEEFMEVGKFPAYRLTFLISIRRY